MKDGAPPLGRESNSLFFEVALPALRRLESLGATVKTELGCKCDIVNLEKGTKRIEVLYEAHGPPFCELHSGEAASRRIEVNVDFPSAERIGRGDKTAAALAELQGDLQRYVDALYPILVKELE